MLYQEQIVSNSKPVAGENNPSTTATFVLTGLRRPQSAPQKIFEIATFDNFAKEEPP